MLLDGYVDGQPAQRLLSPGPFHLGGGPDDDWNVAGLPSRGVRLELEDGAVTVEVSAEVQVHGENLLPGRRRLLLPEERISWGPGSWLTLRAAEPSPVPFTHTAQLVRGLLRGEAVDLGVAALALVALTGRDLGRTFFLTEPGDGGAWELGRGEDVAVRLRDRSVSRRHARLSHRDGLLWLEDLGGPNGVTLNGQAVAGPIQLLDGDVVGLGYTRLKYRAPPASAGAKESLSLPRSEEEPAELVRDSTDWRALPSDGWLAAFFLAAAAVGVWCGLAS